MPELCTTSKRRVQELTTSTISAEGQSFISVGQSILWSESVAECAPESTELFALKNIRNFPSGLEKGLYLHTNIRFQRCYYHVYWIRLIDYRASEFTLLILSSLEIDYYYQVNRPLYITAVDGEEILITLQSKQKPRKLSNLRTAREKD